MKLIFAIVEDDDALLLMDALAKADLRVTKLASTGGFLLQGNTTLMIGAEDAKADQAIGIIQRTCVRRRKLLPQSASEMPTGISMPIEVESGGAIIFSVPVDAVHRI